jgi:hypothetical protein
MRRRWGVLSAVLAGTAVGVMALIAIPAGAGGGTDLRARLTGASGGGEAQFTKQSGDHLTFALKLDKLAMADGTSLRVVWDGTTSTTSSTATTPSSAPDHPIATGTTLELATVSLSRGRAEITLDNTRGDALPQMGSGDSIRVVTNGGTVVLSGRF